MKCQILFSWKNKKTITNLSAELSQRVLKVNGDSELMGIASSPKACASKPYGTAHVSLPSNQTGNKHFVCSLSGSQLMWQIYLYLPGPTGKSGTRIRYQNFNCIAWVLSRYWSVRGLILGFFGRFLALIFSSCIVTEKCVCVFLFFFCFCISNHSALRARL